LYQVLWQRALFAIFGINIESVTMVVTAFMLRLGVGSLGGGILSRKPTRAFLLLFAALEACIGVFGLFSLRLFEILGDWSLSLLSTMAGDGCDDIPRLASISLWPIRRGTGGHSLPTCSQ
jgi:hypothetical protein